MSFKTKTFSERKVKLDWIGAKIEILGARWRIGDEFSLNPLKLVLDKGNIVPANCIDDLADIVPTFSPKNLEPV